VGRSQGGRRGSWTGFGKSIAILHRKYVRKRSFYKKNLLRSIFFMRNFFESRT